MIPALKRNKDAGLGAPVEHMQRKSDEASDDLDDLKVAAQDILDAIKSNNAAGLADALRAAFELCDSEPHVEGEHIDG